MKLVLDMTEYVCSHGARPRGRGSWAFQFFNRMPLSSDAAEVWWTPGSTTFTEARRLAKKVARDRYPHSTLVFARVCS